MCRRWHGVLYSEPALWRYVELSGKALAAAAEAGQSAQWFSTQRAMLQRIGGFVAELIVIDACVVEVAGRRKRECGALQRMAQECGSNWQLTRDVLSHLSPSSLTSLGLLWGPPALDEAAMAALGRLSRLTSLWLESGSSLPTSTADVLPRLPRLQQLALASPVLPASLLAALVQLLALVELDCSGDTLPPLDVLPRISQLTHLRWKEDSRQDGYLRPDVQRLLERLPALESWQIGSGRDIVWHGCMQVEYGWGFCWSAAGPRCMTAWVDVLAWWRHVTAVRPASWWQPTAVRAHCTPAPLCRLLVRRWINARAAAAVQLLARGSSLCTASTTCHRCSDLQRQCCPPARRPRPCRACPSSIAACARPHCSTVLTWPS